MSQERKFFAEMVVDAVNILDDSLPLNMIGIKKVSGGSLNVSSLEEIFVQLVLIRASFEDSRLVKGVAFQKAFSYAGFEMQPKHYKEPLVALLNIELELKAEKDNAEMRLTNVEDFQAVSLTLHTFFFVKIGQWGEEGVTAHPDSTSKIRFSSPRPTMPSVPSARSL